MAVDAGAAFHARLCSVHGIAAITRSGHPTPRRKIYDPKLHFLRVIVFAPWTLDCYFPESSFVYCHNIFSLPPARLIPRRAYFFALQIRPSRRPRSMFPAPSAVFYHFFIRSIRRYKPIAKVINTKVPAIIPAGTNLVFLYSSKSGIPMKMQARTKAIQTRNHHPFPALSSQF